MEYERIKSTFEKKGYQLNTYIDKKEYLKIINSLTVNDAQYLDEVADELWVQAAGERQAKELRIVEICNTIIEAQNILRTKIKETKNEISLLEGEKRRLQSNLVRESIRRIEEIDQELNEKDDELESLESDFRLVTEPFGISNITHFRSDSSPIRNSPSPAGISYQPAYLQSAGAEYNQSPYQTNDGYIESEELKLMLYCTLVFGVLEVIMIYGKSDFLNLIVLVCLLSIYLMNFFDRTYIRLTLSLVVASIILDIVWLVMYAGPKWSPSSVSNNTIYQIGYMRFIIFFTIILIPVKIGMFFFLFKHKDAKTDDKYVFSVGEMKIKLSANQSNPISKGLINAPVLST